MAIRKKKPTRQKCGDVETNNPETVEMMREFIRDLYAAALRRAQDAMEQRTGETETLMGEGKRVDLRKLVLEITGELIPDALAKETAECCSMKKLDDLIQLMPVDTVSIEVGRGLMPLVDPKQGCRLIDRCASIRHHLALELGILMPGIRFRDNLQLKPTAYVLKLKEIEVATGEVILNHFLAIAPIKRLMRLPGELTTDPTYGMPGKWILKNLRGKAERLGCMIFDPVSVIATQLTDVLRSRAAELLGLQEVHVLLEKFRKTHPAVVSEVYPSLLPLRTIRHIVQNLVRERVSVRDLATILETLADHAEGTQNVEALTEYVRRGLSRVICREYMNNEGVMNLTHLRCGLLDILIHHCHFATESVL
jgi:flagellar biosynthesis protein FlhA